MGGVKRRDHIKKNKTDLCYKISVGVRVIEFKIQNEVKVRKWAGSGRLESSTGNLNTWALVIGSNPNCHVPLRQGTGLL